MSDRFICRRHWNLTFRSVYFSICQDNINFFTELHSLAPKLAKCVFNCFFFRQTIFLKTIMKQLGIFVLCLWLICSKHKQCIFGFHVCYSPNDQNVETNIDCFHFFFLSVSCIYQTFGILYDLFRQKCSNYQD